MGIASGDEFYQPITASLLFNSIRRATFRHYISKYLIAASRSDQSVMSPLSRRTHRQLLVGPFQCLYREFGIAFDPYGVEADWQLPIRTILASCVRIPILDRGSLKRERLLLIKLLNLMVVRLYGNFCVFIIDEGSSLLSSRSLLCRFQVPGLQ